MSICSSVHSVNTQIVVLCVPSPVPDTRNTVINEPFLLLCARAGTDGIRRALHS